jgi:hypothetical protein
VCNTALSNFLPCAFIIFWKFILIIINKEVLLSLLWLCYSVMNVMAVTNFTSTTAVTVKISRIVMIVMTATTGNTMTAVTAMTVYDRCGCYDRCDRLPPMRML